MPSPFTPAETAFLDQELADAGERTDRMLRVFREQAAEDGEQQARANLALALSWLPDGERDSLFLAAMIRLARQTGTL